MDPLTTAGAILFAVEDEGGLSVEGMTAEAARTERARRERIRANSLEVSVVESERGPTNTVFDALHKDSRDHRCDSITHPRPFETAFV